MEVNGASRHFCMGFILQPAWVCRLEKLFKKYVMPSQCKVYGASGNLRTRPAGETLLCTFSWQHYEEVNLEAQVEQFSLEWIGTTYPDLIIHPWDWDWNHVFLKKNVHLKYILKIFWHFLFGENLLWSTWMEGLNWYKLSKLQGVNLTSKVRFWVEYHFEVVLCNLF